MSIDHERVASVFAEALARQTPDERVAYLEAACRDDTELRTRVEELLRARDDAGSFLEKPAAEFVATEVTGDPQGLETELDDEAILAFLTPSDERDCLGTIGPYRISEIVSRGGMGIVLKGTDPKLNRVVAVKLLAPELASNASARKRFLREGQAAAAISHDHVVTIYSIDDAAPLPFIAMEYIAGPSLQQRIDEQGALGLKEILRIGKQAAAGLAAAHAEGLVHRDIKPSNLLLENGVERVKITDFGLARAVDDVRLTKPGTVTGTPEYMSPEQARSEPVDHRSDLFSLGCVLFAMCTGRPPFRAENTASIIRRICDDEPRPIREINPDIPDWLAKLVGRLLAKDPDQRFQSASEVADLLGRYLAHVQRPSANPVPPEFEPLPPLSGPTSRRRGRLVAAACALLIGLLGVGFTEATGITEITPTIIQIFRNDGVLIVYVDDPNIQVLLDGEELVITGAGPQQFRLKPGDHQFQAIRDGQPVAQRLVRITRGGEEIVRVEFEPKGGPSGAEAPADLVTTVRLGDDIADFSGAPSPDGRFMTYTDWTTQNLILHEFATGAEQVLAEGSAETGEVAYKSVFSRDGRQVAFNWSGGRSGGIRLRVKDVNESAIRDIPLADAIGWAEPWDWSADGKQVLARLDNMIAFVSITDGTVQEILSFDEPPQRFRAVVSPAGDDIAYSREASMESSQGDVFLVSADGSVHSTVVEHPADDVLLGFSPDGNHVVFASDRGGSMGIWIQGIGNGRPQGNPVNVHQQIGPMTPLGMTRNGSLFYGIYSGWAACFIAELDSDDGRLTGEPRRAFPLEQNANHWAPEWSPDGRLLASRTDRGVFGTALSILDTQSGNVRTVLPNVRSLNVNFLRWSPDARSLLGVRSSSGLTQIDVASGSATALTETGHHPAWSPDGMAIFYVNPNLQRVVRRELASGKEETMYAGHGIRNLDVSPDGEWLAFVAGGQLNVLPAAGGEPTVLHRAAEGTGIARVRSGVAWMRDSRHILFQKPSDDGENVELWRIAADTGESAYTGLSWPENGFLHVRVNQDGRRIAFSAKAQEERSEVWVVRDFLPNAISAEDIPVAISEDRAAGIAIRKVWEGAIDVGGQPSPDGRFLSYADWTTGNLAIRDLRTGETRALTNNDDYANGLPANSRFSPDGRQLAFNWYEEEREQYDLRLIGVDGSGERVIYQDAAHSFTWVADWSSDGRFILGTLVGNGSRELVTVSVDDGTVRVLKSLDPEIRGGRTFARFSPDARHVAFDWPPDGSSNARDVFVLDLKSGVETVLIEHPADDGLMGWAPDGGGVLFRSDRRGTNDVWFVPVADGTSPGDPVLVRADLGPLTSLMGFTQDGSYYYSASLTRMNVYRGDLDLERGEVSNRRFATRLYQDTTHLPDWSPDGTQLAYISERARAGTRLCIQTLETGAEREFPLELDQGLNLRWSPDGSQILVGGFLKRNRQAYIIDAETGEATEFPVHRGAGDVDSHWNPDGSGFYFRNPDRGGASPILHRDAASGEETELYSGEGYIRDLAVSQATGHIAFAEDADGYSIRILDPDSGDVRELTTFQLPDWIAARPGESLDLTPDGRHVLYVKILGDKVVPKVRELWSVPVEGGQPQQLDLAMTWLRHPRVHPDGRQIAFTAGVKQQINVWVIENFLPEASLVPLQADVDVKQPGDDIAARRIWDDATDITGEVSRDGSTLSFVDWRTGDLAVRNLSTGEDRRLTDKGSWDDSGEFALSPRISPDGTQVAYIWFGPDEEYDLRTMSLTGDEPHVVYSNDDGLLRESLFDWSPDGSQLMVLLVDDLMPQLALISVADGSARVIRTLDRGARKGMNARFSPDGRYVACDRPPGSTNEIHLLAIDGREEIPIVTGLESKSLIGWSPDGEWLVFSIEGDGRSDAWGIRVADGAPQGEPRLLQSDFRADSSMGITRDGTLFYGIEFGGPQVHVASLGSDEELFKPTPLPGVSLSTGQTSSPSWSPDGEQLAYLSRTAGNRQSIRILSLQSSDLRELIPQQRNLWLLNLRWSPDGASFLAATAEQRRIRFCRIDAVTGTVTPLLPPAGEPAADRSSRLGRAVPTPDGNAIIYVKGNGIIYRNLSTSREREILPVGNSLSGASPGLMIDISPDSATLDILGREPDSGEMVLRTLPVEGGEARELLRFENASTRGTAVWMPDGEHLLLFRPSSDESLHGLWRVPVDGSPPIRLAADPNLFLQDLAVHPDGDRIAFRSIRPTQSFEVWTLENFLPAGESLETPLSKR